MRITFYGAAREVTGSMYLVEANGARILLECGMFQGRRAEAHERNLNLPFEPSSIDAMVLSHAHIDHSGNIPNLVKQGYKGSVWCTAATRNLCSYMLMDSGHIQESDTEYLNKKRAKSDLPPVEPLYTMVDVRAALGQLVSIGLHRKVRIADGVDLTFYNAGHILGSAFVALDVNERGSKRLIFSGDLGRDGAPILRPPEKPEGADVLIIESTYGERLHATYDEARDELQDAVRSTVRRHGKMIIPAFAVGRTQEIVYALNQLEAEGDIPALPIYVDSPLAISATEVFRMHPEEWDDETRAFLTTPNGTGRSASQRKNPFDSEHIEYVRDARRSKQLNYIQSPAIIISASGMAESGRILHHLKNNIEDADNTVLFVGFQAQDTLGRRIKDGDRRVRVFGEEYEVRAHVVAIDGYSAHADQAELIAWAGSLDRERLQRAFVVHGEPAAGFTFAEKLRGEGFREVAVPERGESLEV